jgi:hypothetical protein
MSPQSRKNEKKHEGELRSQIQAMPFPALVAIYRNMKNIFLLAQPTFMPLYGLGF